MAVVYVHKIRQTGVVFYVGIGLRESRAFQKKYRNNHWRNIVNKHEYDVEIMERDLSWSDACLMEIDLISKYKRHVDGGSLCNITKGGEGVVGICMSDNHKKKISNSNKGKKRSIETRLRISKSRKGIVFSESHRLNISKSRTGKNMSEEFKMKRSQCTTLGMHPLAKEVVDLFNGIFYSCIKEACIATNTPYSREIQRIRRGHKDARFSLV